MEAVLKIGGSLAEQPENLLRLCRELTVLAETHKMVVVPGGGEFADTVRLMDKKYRLSNVAAHKMAILAMDQYGILLSNIAPNSYVSSDINEIMNPNGKLLIFLPSKYMFQENPLKNSWDVTSDTISAHIARVLKSRKLILVTDVDGVLTHDPKLVSEAKLIEHVSVKELLERNERTSVDKALPEILLQTKLECYVVNGKYPERVKQILENKKTVCTHITT